MENETNETVEYFYSNRTLLIAVTTVGISAYVMGSRKGYVNGVKDGIKLGIAEGRLEGYVKAISDLAALARS